jgi:hypothetical protein
MITQMLTDSNMFSEDRRCLEELLKRVNYPRISKSMAFADTSSIPVSIPLFSYVFSDYDQKIAHVERVPGTLEAIHTIVMKDSFMEKLRALFVVNDRMSLKLRRTSQSNEVVEMILQVNPLEQESQIETEEYRDEIESLG